MPAAASAMPRAWRRVKGEGEEAGTAVTEGGGGQW
jgi:hypothetical protein